MAKRKRVMMDGFRLSVYIPKKMHLLLQDLASMQTTHLNRPISLPEMVRNAIHFTYDDNERMRACFKRWRSRTTTELYRREFKDDE